MKQAFFLFFLAALITGCGSSSHYNASSDTLDIGYGVQDKDKVTTAVSNVKVKKHEAQTYSDMYVSHL